MKETGERLFPQNPGTLDGLDISHIERYRWASAFTRGKKVYDLACGTGYGASLLEAGEYKGFDNSAEAIEFANQHFGSDIISFEEADACAMPENLDPVEVIVSFETIEHLKQPEELVKWCASHTKLLVISSPIKISFGRSHFHLFEYKVHEFEEVLNRHFPKMQMLVQKLPGGIIYLYQPKDKGVAIAICQK